MELYKEYRPITLDEVEGQSTVKKSIQKMIDDDSLPHVILIHGPSGTGKTTLARIICSMMGVEDIEKSPDVVELNAASARGIETVRDMERAAHMKPLQGRGRFWIIDECHMMTTEAQNASLKIFEDTPKSAYFILCTTDPGKLKATIRNRATKFQLSALSDSQIYDYLKWVSEDAKLNASKEVLEAIVENSEGSARDAVVTLELVMTLDESEQLDAVARTMNQGGAADLCRALIAKRPWPEIVERIEGVKGEDPERLRRMILSWSKSVLLTKKKPGPNQEQAYKVIYAFQANFFDNGDAGLVASCWESTFS